MAPQAMAFTCIWLDPGSLARAFVKELIPLFGSHILQKSNRGNSGVIYQDVFAMTFP